MARDNSRSGVFNLMVKEPYCSYCLNKAELVSGNVIYHNRKDLRGQKFWLCRPCGAYVGTHKNSRNHAPLGTLAKKELRALRSRLHTVFDPIWKSGKKTRSEAYFWLASRMGIEQKECHISMFCEQKCLQALSIVIGEPIQKDTQTTFREYLKLTKQW